MQASTDVVGEGGTHMDKAKVNHNPAWLNDLLGPVYLDFIAPEPLEDAIRLLKEQQTEGFFRLEKMAVDLTPVDADTFRFKMTLRGYKKNRVEAHGLLKRWERHTTHCTARVNVAPYTYLLFAIPLVVVFVFFPYAIRMPLAMLPYVVFLFGAIGLSSYFARQRVRQLARRIETVLHAPEFDP